MDDSFLQIADLTRGATPPLSVPRKEVKRYLGYTNQALSDDLDAHIEALISEGECSFTSSWIYRTFQLKDVFSFFDGSDIRSHMQGATACVLFACTLGVSGEKLIRTYGVKSPLAALVMDATASAYIEEVANYCEANIVNQAQHCSLVVNGRFSPGYGDFALSHQKDLLTYLDAGRKIGLSCTEQSLLVPSKSITACLGLFDNPDAPGMHTHLYPQRFCSSCVCFNYCHLRKENMSCCR